MWPKLIQYNAVLHSLASDFNSVRFSWLWVILRRKNVSKTGEIWALSISGSVYFENLASLTPFPQCPFREPFTALPLMPAPVSSWKPLRISKVLHSGAWGESWLRPVQHSHLWPRFFFYFSNQGFFLQFWHFFFRWKSWGLGTVLGAFLQKPTHMWVIP